MATSGFQICLLDNLDALSTVGLFISVSINDAFNFYQHTIHLTITPNFNITYNVKTKKLNDTDLLTIDPLSSTYLDNAIDSRSATTSEISGRFVGSTCNILPKHKTVVSSLDIER